MNLKQEPKPMVLPHKSPISPASQNHSRQTWKFASRKVEDYLLMTLLIIVGVFLTTQIKTAITLQNQTSNSKHNYAQYQQQLSDLTAENQQLKLKNEELIVKKDTLAQDVLNQQGYSELAQSLTRARTLAGFTVLSGAGITITLNDSTITDPSNTNQSSLIHAQDVEKIVDILKASGATAIAVNGERIVNTSIIICTGPNIRINNSKHPFPFIITALCDPNTTYDLLQNDPYIQKRKAELVTIDIEKNGQLTIPAFSDTAAVDRFFIELGGEITS